MSNNHSEYGTADVWVNMPICDPFPYVGEYGSRHAYPGTLNGKPLEFAPRDGFWQQESRYEHRS